MLAKVCPLTLAVAALLAGLAWFVTQRWVPAWGSAPIIAAAIVNVLSCWVAAVPLEVASRGKREYMAQAALLGILIRLIGAGGATLALLAISRWESSAICIWMVAFYVALLAVETSIIVAELHTPTKQEGQVAPT